MISNTKLACKNMLDTQLETNGVNDELILKAISEVPREDFVPAKDKRSAYVDDGLELENGKYLSSPLVLARMVLAAEISTEHSVLEIGCATGYLTAVISKLAKKVTAIDDSTKIVNMAKSNLAKLEIKNAEAIKANLIAGNEKEAPYDVIIINGAVQEVPNKILSQLCDGGRLVTVLSGFITTFEHKGNTFSEARQYQANTKEIAAFAKAKGFEF